MFQIHPKITLDLNCPYCQAKGLRWAKERFWGKFILASGECLACGEHFEHTLPSGHSLLFPMARNASGFATHYPYQDWYHRDLKSADQLEAPIGREKRSSKKRALLLHCLDPTFGHIFFRLLNAQAHLKEPSEYALIVLIPKKLRHLVPEAVDEVWWVDTELPNFRKEIVNLDAFVQKQKQRFTEMYLSYAYIQPDVSKIDIAKFTKVAPFKSRDFLEKSPQITLIYREDRLLLEYPWDIFLDKVQKKFPKAPGIKSYLQRRQRRFLKKLVRALRQKEPLAKLVLLAYSSKPFQVAGVQNELFDEYSPEQEQRCLEIYAQSHLVIGVHGSNLLLPSALAGACIEILPDYKLDHYTEALAFSYADRRAHFLMRSLAMGVKPKQIAQQAHSILKKIPFFLLNLAEEYQPYEESRGLFLQVQEYMRLYWRK